MPLYRYTLNSTCTESPANSVTVVNDFFAFGISHCQSLLQRIGEEHCNLSRRHAKCYCGACVCLHNTSGDPHTSVYPFVILLPSVPLGFCLYGPSMSLVFNVARSRALFFPSFFVSPGVVQPVVMCTLSIAITRRRHYPSKCNFPIAVHSGTR